MSRHRRNEQTCFVFHDEVAKAGTRFLGETTSSPLFFQVATPICKSRKVCCIRGTISDLSFTTVPPPTFKFTLVKTSRTKCGGIFGPLKTVLTVTVTDAGQVDFCLCRPVFLCPGENIAVIVEPSNPDVTFLASAEVC